MTPSFDPKRSLDHKGFPIQEEECIEAMVGLYHDQCYHSMIILARLDKPMWKGESQSETPRLPGLVLRHLWRFAAI